MSEDKAVICYVAMVEAIGGGTHTIWTGDGGEAGDEFDLMWDLVDDGQIDEPGFYIVARPHDDILCGHMFTLTQNDGDWEIYQGVEDTNVRKLHRWPPKH